MKTTTTMLVLLLFLSGCSNDSAFEGIADDSGRKAVIEEAAMALDDEDYASAIQMLTEIYTTTSPDPRVSRLLSSAYMGWAGVDFVRLIEFSGQEEREDFEMVASSLSLSPVSSLDNMSTCSIADRTVMIMLNESNPDNEDYLGAQFIDGHCIGGLLEGLERAQYILNILINANRHSLDDEIQLGVASAAHFVFYIGNRVADALNRTLVKSDPEDRLPGLVPIPINKDAYRFYTAEKFSNDQSLLSVMEEEDFREEHLGLLSLNTYQEDLINVYYAVRAFERATPEQNDVRDTLQDFLACTLNLSDTPASEIDVNDIISTMNTTGVFNLVSGLSAK